MENMDLIDGLDFINKAFEKRLESKNWDMWISRYQHMDKNTYVSFEEFCKGSSQKVENLTNEEVLEKSENVRKVHQKNHPGINPKKLSKEEIETLVKGGG